MDCLLEECFFHQSQLDDFQWMNSPPQAQREQLLCVSERRQTGKEEGSGGRKERGRKGRGREGWHVTWLWQTAHNWHPSKPAEYTSRYRAKGGWGRRKPRGWCRWACGTGYLSPASWRALRSRWPSLWRRWWPEEPLPGLLSAMRW